MSNRNYVLRNTTVALPTLLKEVMTKGQEVGSRNGRVKELEHIGITLTHPTERILAVPFRKNNLAAQIAETMWVISGRDDIKWLSRYLPRAVDYSDDGEVWRGAYGPRIRAWRGKIDQLEYVIDTLKAHPLSRQAVIAIFDPLTDTQPGKDIPCNDLIVFSDRLGELDMNVTIRSNDVIWGWSGINVFEWSMLQEIVARCLDIQVGRLHFNIASFHVYEPHWEKARQIAEDQNVRSLGEHIKFDPTSRNLNHIDSLIYQWFNVERKIRKGTDTPDDIDGFPEPLWRSWLRVIKWWWTAEEEHLEAISRTAVGYGTTFSIQPTKTEEEIVVTGSVLVDFIDKVHREKGAAYGDSWKKRGEMLSILANIARKIDRLLVGGETSDETLFDTAMDTVVYLAKYRWWLTNEAGAPSPVELAGHAEEYNEVRELLEALDRTTHALSDSAIESIAHTLDTYLDDLTSRAERSDPERYLIADVMLRHAWRAVAFLWESR